MKRSLTLIALLATMLVVAACGGSDTGRSDPVEPRRTQAESDQQSAPQETAREEATRKGTPANDEAAQGEQESTQEDSSSGLSVTTIEGEQVNLGGQGDVTALYFMAGW
ncbi:MAG TPA: hypothetical protein VGR18_05195 [Rubrobacter sp.]|nr:hypothetical protein [Rubrobacter sp.]